ncbi:EAL domain-containing protein [Pleurocapsales cyanobacterium LEGE 06147]|nr:EAL domain-containing protein [Pleurocapsales cyanobacterium LEGE 06147]
MNNYQKNYLDQPKGNILIVDDIPDNLRVLSATLTEQNYRVRCAKNGLMALKGALRMQPDLILLDIKMPDMDGYEVCQQLKANDQTREIPVIFLSALDDVLDKIKAFEVGGVDYITKPFQVAEVLARVTTHITLQTAKREIEKLNQQLEQRVQKRTVELEAANQQLKQEIAERERIEQQLVHDALHDTLTGLPNRNLLMERIEFAIQHTKRHENYLFAVLFIDLDRFKLVNDSLGHLVGDRLLMAIAHILQECLRGNDMVARLGGDEFVILLDDIQDITYATKIAEHIQTKLRSPLNLANQTVFTSASIGIVLSSTGYQNSSDLLRDADIAMYRAKGRGKARYEVFDQAMYAQTLELLQLENNLRLACRRGEFLLHYQPIVSLLTGELLGFEALLRWQHPEKGLILPAQFIDVAEDTGLIIPIGEWVLRVACHQLRTWQLQFPSVPRVASLKMSVNLASQQLKEPQFAQKLDRILQETGLDGNCLKLEFTESMLIDSGEATQKILSQIRNKGIQLGIDDFGKGYSSLSYLHRFPINTLKIDRSFVSQMNIDRENFEIVRTIITLAHTLGMDAIAEGVEDIEQFTQLQQLGCEFAQGYLFSKPLERRAAESVIAMDSKYLTLFRKKSLGLTR